MAFQNRTLRIWKAILQIDLLRFDAIFPSVEGPESMWLQQGPRFELILVANLAVAGFENLSQTGRGKCPVYRETGKLEIQIQPRCRIYYPAAERLVLQNFARQQNGRAEKS
jgi:hypothetical protein